MADVFSKKKRSEVMSRIRSRGNQATEVALAGLFRRHKITGWRRQVKLRVTSGKWRVTRKSTPHPAQSHSLTRPAATLSHPMGEGQASLAVRPDFVFRRARLALFVDGCFWHGCPKHATQPKGNRAFWRNKFARNRARDLLVTRTLRSAGWRVLRIWEHELARRNEARLIRRMQRTLK
jgi:DNA mismatch endonuclease (patch repair protein)